MAAQLHGFQTEVAKLLDLLANSLYSNKEVFLRELISNASDALDKLHFLSLTDQKLLGDDPILRIRVKADKDAGTLTISDNGIGMTVEEAQEHLGTIAKSGTDEFFKSLSGDAAKDSQLIGRFGVGFYSAFIVADKVTVYSRSAKAAQNEGVCWESEGLGTYTAERIDRKERGTDIVLHLKADAPGFWKQRSRSIRITSPYLFISGRKRRLKPRKKGKSLRHRYLSGCRLTTPRPFGRSTRAT